MSEREMLMQEIQELPDYKISYLLGVVRGLSAEIPNEETLASFKEMQTGEYKTFDNADALFADLGI